MAELTEAEAKLWRVANAALALQQADAEKKRAASELEAALKALQSS